MKGRFWRKALAAALALLVVSGNVPIRPVADLFGGAAITASAEDELLGGRYGFSSTYWQFDSETGKLTISGTGAMYNYYTFQPWYQYRDNIISVEIENGVTSIDNYAFESCSNLTSITISDSVESIGDFAFYYCSSLKSVTIPDSVTSIGKNVFYNCTNITDVYCYAKPNTLTWDEGGCDDFKKDGSTVCHVREGDLDTYKSEKFSDVNVKFQAEAMDKCGDHAYWCFESKTRKLTISGTGDMWDFEFNYETATVNSPWFAYRDDITSVEIENGITSVGNLAFFRCTGLTSIEMPDSVTNIGTDAFYGCTNIKEVSCDADPEKLTWDEDRCDDFMGDTESRETICHVPGKYYWQYVKKFGAESENPVNVTFDTDAPHGQCGESAYWLFDSETSTLTISGTGDMADYEFDLETVTVNSPWYAYKDNITSVEIENGITSIGNSAFDSCANLTSVSIPDSVTSIGEVAFALCEGLTSITIPDSVESIGDYAFAYCEGLKSVEIASGVESIGKSAFNYCTGLTSIEIPASVTSIGESAFDSCTGLTSITLPDSVTSIGVFAFSGCSSLTSIVIPAKVTNIGANAFSNCTNITDVYCYADPANLTWEDYKCNDFKKDGSTVCHVPKNYLETYEKNFGAESENPVNVRFVGDVDMGLGEHLYGHSITLDGSIGVNFYVELTDELLASDTAAMVFTVPNGSKTDTQTLLVKDVIADDKNKVSIGSKTYYKFKCSISAKDMASTITAQLVDGEKSGTKYTYSVKDYADYLLEHPEVDEYAEAAPLVKAMLNYGAASQRYFNEGTVIGEVEDMEDVTVPNTFKFDEANANLPEGVTFEGATLSLKSETTLSLYFKGLPAETVFTCDVKTVETAKNGKYVVARIRGIKASELENSFTVTFEGDSVTYKVTYNVMTYCYNVLNDGKVDDNLKNVCKALYKYAQAAKTYSE